MNVISIPENRITTSGYSISPSKKYIVINNGILEILSKDEISQKKLPGNYFVFDQTDNILYGIFNKTLMKVNINGQANIDQVNNIIYVKQTKVSWDQELYDRIAAI